MSDLSNKVMEQIKERGISPLPKWRFLLRNSVSWVLFGISLLVGSVSVAMALYLSLSADTSVAALRVQDLFSYIPVFWFVLLALFLYVSVHNFIHTDEGYRWNTFKVFGLSLLLSLLIGVGFILCGGSDRLNAYLAQNVPYYHQFGDMRAVIWNNPDGGRIAGTVLSIDEKVGQLKLQDISGTVWEVDLTKSDIRPSVTLENNESVKILGEKTGTKTFKAIEVRPWNGNNSQSDGENQQMQGKRQRMRNNR